MLARHPLGRGVPETADRNGSSPRLNDEQRARVRALGVVRSVEPGEILYREGDESYDFFVVESGAVMIVQGYGVRNRVIAVHGRHRFIGELNLLIGGRVYLTAVVRDAGEVIQVPADRLKRLVQEDEDFSNVVLRSFLERRSMLIGLGAGHRVIGSRYSADSRRLREFLARNRVPYDWVDLEEDPEAEQLLRAAGVESSETPVVLLANDGILRNPANGELAARIGLGARGGPPSMCDLIIVGLGPAGLAAAVYAASEGLDVQAIDAVAVGGQAATSSRIENYLGFPAGISGGELAGRAQIQAAKFGARLVVPDEAVALERESGHYAIGLAGGRTVRGRTIIVASGAQYRKLDVPDLERYEGLGVYYAATQTEAQRSAGTPVVIVGGGNSAGQASVFLSRGSDDIRLLIRGGGLESSMSRYLIDEVARRERVHLEPHSEVVGLDGEDGLEAVIVADNRSGERRRIAAKALFVFIGATPHTGWLRGQVAMDEHGFVLTGRDVQGEHLASYGADRPLFLETSLPGVFAVGDARSGSIKRVTSAVGEGAMGVSLLHQRLEALVAA